MAKKKKISVKGTEVTISVEKEGEYISLTDMLKAKDGDFFISDWLRNRNTVEFLGIWESVNNPHFNYGEFATIKSQAGLNSYKISVKEWNQKTNGCISAVRAIASIVVYTWFCIFFISFNVLIKFVIWELFNILFLSFSLISGRNFS